MSAADRLLNRPRRSTSVTLAVDPADADRLAVARATLALTSSVLRRAEQRAAEQQRPTKRVRREVETARAARQSAQDALDALEAEVVTVTFTVGPAIVEDEGRTYHGPLAVDRLIGKCPPRRDQVARLALQGSGATAMTHDPDAFQPRLVAACCRHVAYSDGTTADGLSEAEAVAIWQTAGWPEDDLVALYDAARMVNERTSRIDEQA